MKLLKHMAVLPKRDVYTPVYVRSDDGYFNARDGYRCFWEAIYYILYTSARILEFLFFSLYTNYSFENSEFYSICV